jgi:hypothetical protein
MQIPCRLLRTFSTKGKRCILYNNGSAYLRQGLDQPIRNQSNNATRAASSAFELFRKARLRGVWAKLRSALEKTPNSLIDLNDIKEELKIESRHYAGIKPVPISKIRGTLGRGNDFSIKFAPLHENTRERWLSIATARFQGTPLPAIELIQIDEAYFVVDGHHRISVAKALGEQAVDAVVTVWDVERPMPVPVMGEPLNNLRQVSHGTIR